jgi:GT2 family glycosyltransferase
LASIFIQLASYHDFELGKTMYDALYKSSKFHEIHFGVHNCYYQEKEMYIPQYPNLKLVESLAPENIGVGISRSIANSLYDGQDYYLQVDAHTRFEYNWDDSLIKLIEEYKELGFEKPLISMYPGTWKYNDNLKEVIEWSVETTSTAFKDRPEMFEETMIPNQVAVPPENWIYQKAIAGGFIFTTGDYAELGVNEKIMFYGEEIIMAARAYTHGYDLLIPDKHYLYHLYFETESVFQKNMRRHTWKDFYDEWVKLEAVSKAEVVDILTNKRIGPGALGTVRTLEEYGEYAGLDFVNRKLLNVEEADV